jgi:hypothetical protein
VTIRRYVVRQGDYLAKLAFHMGFDASAVWNDRANRELRERRSNPDMLHPGDILSIPEPPAPTHIRISPGAHVAARAIVPTTEVKLVVHDDQGRALANAAFHVTGAGAEIAGTSDGSGTVSFEVPIHVSEVRVVVDGLEGGLRVLIGHMDPLEEASGVRKRLQHLNYLGGDIVDEEVMVHHLRSAIGMFQHDHGLAITGEVDDATRAALLDRHGS